MLELNEINQLLASYDNEKAENLLDPQQLDPQWIIDLKEFCVTKKREEAIALMSNEIKELSDIHAKGTETDSAAATKLFRALTQKILQEQVAQQRLKAERQLKSNREKPLSTTVEQTFSALVSEYSAKINRRTQDILLSLSFINGLEQAKELLYFLKYSNRLTEKTFQSSIILHPKTMAWVPALVGFLEQKQLGTVENCEILLEQLHHFAVEQLFQTLIAKNIANADNVSTLFQNAQQLVYRENLTVLINFYEDFNADALVTKSLDTKWVQETVGVIEILKKKRTNDEAVIQIIQGKLYEYSTDQVADIKQALTMLPEQTEPGVTKNSITEPQQVVVDVPDVPPFVQGARSASSLPNISTMMTFLSTQGSEYTEELCGLAIPPRPSATTKLYNSL